MVSLIQISKFNEAIQFIERAKLNQLVFERAYVQYRLNQPEKALKTIDNCDLKPLPDNLKELRAQVLYRLEMFDECFDAYKNIIKNSSDDYEDERATNLSAVAANLAIEGSVTWKQIIFWWIQSNESISNFRPRTSPTSEKTRTNWLTTVRAVWPEEASSMKRKRNSALVKKCAAKH